MIVKVLKGLIKYGKSILLFGMLFCCYSYMYSSSSFTTMMNTAYGFLDNCSLEKVKLPSFNLACIRLDTIQFPDISLAMPFDYVKGAFDSVVAVSTSFFSPQLEIESETVGNYANENGENSDTQTFSMPRFNVDLSNIENTSIMLNSGERITPGGVLIWYTRTCDDFYYKYVAEYLPPIVDEWQGIENQSEESVAE